MHSTVPSVSVSWARLSRCHVSTRVRSHPLWDAEERKDPELLARSPALRKRIADDSGKTQEEVLEP